MQDKTPAHGIETGRAAEQPADPRTEPWRAGWGTLWLFTVTTFLSALLLFTVQPMFAKMVLPVLGGSPSVWAVAMLFFQAALLAGYCYAHLLLRFLPATATGFVHLAVCGAAFVVLPIGLPAWFGEPPAGEPYLWQLGLFSVAVGLPFFAVAANAPLLQAWFANTGHSQSADPYFLYAASNLGSFLALLGYPLVLEPVLGLRALSWWWTVGFAGLIAILTVSFLVVRRASEASSGAATIVSPEPTTEKPRWSARFAWVGLALVPSALLTAFTTHVSTDVASAPLIWVMPLALYLLTFVLVFRQTPAVRLPVGIMIGLSLAVTISFAGERFFSGSWDEGWRSLVSSYSLGGLGLMIGIATGIGALLLQTLMPVSPMAWMRGLHLVAVVAALFVLSQTRYESWFISATVGIIVFFSSTMVAHRTLYEARPAPAHLTEFYLYMSLGGALGGLFAALIAPKIFSEVFEYPILLALTMACRPRALAGIMEGFRAVGRRSRRSAGDVEPAVLEADRKRIDELMVLWILIALGGLALLVGDRFLSWLRLAEVEHLPGALWWIRTPLSWLRPIGLWSVEWGVAAAIAGFFALLVITAWRQPTRQLISALVMCTAVVLLPSGVRRSDAERSYFGVYRVYESGNYNILMHGTTLHGAQKIRNDTGERVVDTSPTTYYHPTSPMARSVEIAREHIAAKGGSGRFGVIGLGSGSLACHASEGERWRFFEIDPVMVGIATNPDNFSYLANCQPNPPDIVIGDARLTLAREPSSSFDLLIVDAFSSDAVPVHLMTAEALRLYLDKVGPNGLAVLHVSNRYLDLDGVLAATVKLVTGAHGLVVSDDSADGGYGSTSSTIVVLSRNPDSLEPFKQNSGDVSELDARSGDAAGCPDESFKSRIGCAAVQVLRATNLAPGRSGLRPWTDDFSDVLGPFLTKMRPGG